MGESEENKKGLFQSIKVGLGGRKEDAIESRKGGSMITGTTSISYPFDVVHKRNVAPPGAPPDLYSSRPLPQAALGVVIEKQIGGSMVSPKSGRPVSSAPYSPSSARNHSSPPRAISPRRSQQSPPRSSRDRPTSPRRSSPTRAASPRRGSPTRPSSPRQRAASPRRRSPSRSKSPSRSSERRSPTRRVSPSRVRSPREDNNNRRDKDRDRDGTSDRAPQGKAERATSPRRAKSPVRTYTRPTPAARTPPTSRNSPSSSPSSGRPRTAAERRADREKEREARERERDSRERRRGPRGAVEDLNIGPRVNRREALQRSQRKKPREDARAVTKHLAEKATVRTADVRKRAADTGDLPFFGVTRVRPVNTTRSSNKPRLVLKGDDEEERAARWTRSDTRAFLRSCTKFDHWVEERNLKPLLEARRATGRSMTMALDAPPPAIQEIAELTKEELMSVAPPPSLADSSKAAGKPGKKKRFKSLPASYWMRFVGRAMASGTPHSESPGVSPSPSSTNPPMRTQLPLQSPAEEQETALQFLASTSPRGKNPASPLPKGLIGSSSSADAERLRNLLAGKGTGVAREDGLFVSSPSLISSTQPSISQSVAVRRQCILATVQELLTPRPPEEQAVVKERIDIFLLTYRAYCNASELLRLLEEMWMECIAEKLAEPDRVKQNILYLVWRWINTAYANDFLKENGLPDPSPYKGLSTLMLHMSDTHQKGLSSKIGELSEAPFPKDILDRPLPARVSWIENRANQILRPDFSIMTLPVKDIARAFLLHDVNWFGKLRRIELLARAYPRLSSDGILAVTGVLPQLTTKWNATQTWVSNEIVSTPKLKERALLLEKFIFLAEELYSVSRDYHTFYAVMFGLKDPTVTRLKTTWQRLPADTFALFTELDKETDFGRSYRTYRATVVKAKEDQPDLPLVPFIVVPLSDLVLLSSQTDMVDASGTTAADGTVFNALKASNVSRIISEFEVQQRELNRWLDQMNWDENDVAVLRQLPVSHLDRFKGITQDTLLELSKWVEPSSLA